MAWTNREILDGWKRLSVAKLSQAWRDANLHPNSHWGKMAKNLLMAKTKYWKDGLEYWCLYAELNPEIIVKRCVYREENNLWGEGNWWDETFRD